ncbi:MAG: hypothetical protein ACYCVD_02085 [Desulfitobacteriaceae bacterium]
MAFGLIPLGAGLVGFGLGTLYGASAYPPPYYRYPYYPVYPPVYPPPYGPYYRRW